jgi:hypothetical protein
MDNLLIISHFGSAAYICLREMRLYFMSCLIFSAITKIFLNHCPHYFVNLKEGNIYPFPLTSLSSLRFLFNFLVSIFCLLIHFVFFWSM